MDPIVIIGGGIIGSGLAYALRDAPARVVLVERDSLGSGTTAASIAMFMWMIANRSELDRRLRDRSWAKYEPLIDQEKIDFQRTGSLYCARSGRQYKEYERITDVLRDLDLETEMRTDEGLREFNVRPGQRRGGMYTPDAGYLDPMDIIQYWTGAAVDAGVEVKTGVEVMDIQTEGGSVVAVETSEGKLEAGTVINAAGPWSPLVSEMVDISIPIRHTRGEIIVLQTNEDFSLPFVMFENGDYYRKDGKNRALVGRFRTEYRGAKLYQPDGDYNIETEFKESIVRDTPRRIPALEGGDITNEWVGLRSVTPDGLPLLGPTEIDGFHLATGMSGEGVTIAPAVTSALADYILTGSSDVVNRLSYDRFDSTAY